MISEKFPNASKQQMSQAKRLIENNETIARMAIAPPLELDKMLQYSNNEEIKNDIENEIDKIRNSSDLQPGSVHLHKAFSDIFESFVGAVLVDSQFSFFTINKIFKPYFEAYLYKWIPDEEAFEKDYLKYI